MLTPQEKAALVSAHDALGRLKRCTRCLTDKPLADFHKTAKRGELFGVKSKCKACRKSEQAEWYRNNLDACRKRTRESHRRMRSAMTSEQSRLLRRSLDPKKRKARQAVIDAVRSGRLIKPDSCGDCGTPTEKRKLHGHHECYDRPLDVVWCCHTCHMKRHNNYIELERNVA